MSIGILGLPIFVIGLVVAILAIIFIIVPVLKGIGWLIAGAFKGIGWFVAHIFEYVFGTIGDAIRLVGAIPVWLIFGVLAILNVLIGRWSAAAHFNCAANREFAIGGGCIYRMVIRRPLKLVYLHGLLEGFEQRIPDAVCQVPGPDKPGKRTGTFDGYTIVGSLRGGGSGGKLYIAEPTPQKRAAIPGIPSRVVIKSFAVGDGSSIPQIIRESRALECAKHLGHVIEHGMEEHRFHYVMPYIPGDHLGIVTRELHASSDQQGLGGRQLEKAVGYTCDLLATLRAFHDEGFWHKDVKPENIIVNDDRAHLVDLGLVTALRSAMTLTTHGTEYFRDPEMVRQALRGVKVHQVDGAKFDVYAAGAVLYFMLENTFPAHGGLSVFHKKSPEALHWIVRRAMADYAQRYETAEQMLIDLYYVRQQADPWAVRPAQLPSMSGGREADVPIEAPDLIRVARASTPATVPFSAGEAAGEQRAATTTGHGPQPVARPDLERPHHAAGARARRPRLRVTNWWTGAYEVEDPGVENAEDGAFSDLHEDAGLGRRDVRRSAAEQLAAARRRASEVRSRARTRGASSGAARKHLRAPAERQPTLSLVVFGFLFVGVVVAIVLLLSSATERERFVVPAGAPVVIVNNHALPNHPNVQSRVEALRQQYARIGFDVFLADEQAAMVLGDAIAQWLNDDHADDDTYASATFPGEDDESTIRIASSGISTGSLLRPSDRDAADTTHAASRLETLMELNNVYGVLAIEGEGPRHITARFLYSRRPEARERRRAPAKTAQVRSVFVVNDVPSRDSGDMSPRMMQHLRQVANGAIPRVVQDAAVADDVRSWILLAEQGDDDAQRSLDVFLQSRGLDAALWFDQDRGLSDTRSYITHIHEAQLTGRPGNDGDDDDAFEAPTFVRGGRLLLVNDHPALIHENVMAYEDRARSYYESRGFEIVEDNDAAAAVYTVVRQSSVGAALDTMERVVQDVLAQFDLDAVLLIERGDDSQPAHLSIRTALFERIEHATSIANQ